MTKLVRVAVAMLTGLPLLASCGVTMPDPLKLEKPCKDLQAQVPAQAPTTLFFASTNIPDCRKGRYRFSGYRQNNVTHGLSSLTAEKNPWRTHHSAKMEKELWTAALTQRASAAGPTKPITVYIHGYFSSFEDGLERGYKLAGLGRAGAPVVVVTWPSRNRMLSYTYDEASVEWTASHFEDLLVQLTAISDDITLVAHSMGNRAAIAAVLGLDRLPDSKSEDIRRIVLASPDVDRDAAMRKGGYLDTLAKKGERKVLVYTSSADIPNRLSHRAHGFARLGSSDCRFDMTYALQQSGEEDCHLRPEHPRVTLVNTGRVHSGGTRHADFVNSCATREDLRRFMNDDAPPDWRSKQNRDGLVGWYLDPAKVPAWNALCEVVPPKRRK